MNSLRYALQRFVAPVLALSLLLIGVYLIVAPAQARLRAERVRATFVEKRVGTVTLAVETNQEFHGRLGKLLAEATVSADVCRMELQASANPQETIMCLRSGTPTLGFMTGGYGRDTSDLLALASLGRQYVHVIVSADSKVTTFRELAGKRIGVGPKDYPAETLAKALIAYYQFAAPPEILLNQIGDWEATFRNGGIDALLLVEPLYGPEVEKLLATGWYRLVPIPEASALERYWPGLIADSIPPAVYGPDRQLPEETPTPTATVAVNTFLVALQDAPNEAVCSALDRVFRMDRVAAHLPALSEAQARETAPLRLHPGAEGYYRRYEASPRKDIEVVACFLLGWMLLVAGARGLVWVSGWRRRLFLRRRINAHFSRVAGCGQNLEGAETPRQLSAALREMSATQKKVERDWCDGKMESDDAALLYAALASRSLDAVHKVLSPQWWDEPVREDTPTVPVSHGSAPSPEPLDYFEAEEEIDTVFEGEDGVVLGGVRPRSAALVVETPRFDTPVDVPDVSIVHPAPVEEVSPEPVVVEEPQVPRKARTRRSLPGTKNKADEDEQMELFS